MSSSMWRQSSKVCGRITRPVHSAQVQRHFYARQHVALSHPSSIYLRRESSLATQRRVDLDPFAPVVPIDSPMLKNEYDRDLPLFMSLKGSVSYETLKAITVKPLKLTHMSPVQAEVLPLLPTLAEPYDGTFSADSPPRDLLVKAKTGTGKTMAFLVPAIEARIKAIDAFGKLSVRNAGLTSDENLEARARKVFGREHVGTLIISPTRELATQIADEALRLTRYHDGFEIRLFTGGASKRFQMRDWMRGRRDIVVSTPGRLRDLLASEPEVARGISKTQVLVLDEADTLLDMGFRDDIEAIKEYLPPVPERQTFLFSATVSRPIQQVARSTLAPNHRYINCVTEHSSPVHAHVDQYHTVLPSAGHQIPHILRLIAHDQLSNPGHSKMIVFLPTTKMTQLFATLIREISKATLPAGRNTRVYEIHSKRPQASRTSTSESFRGDKSGASVLVTSDVSARGIDYPGVTRVIQVGIPGSTEQYVHRVGRTGRAGTQGRGDLVLLPWEIGFVTWQLTEVPLKPLTVHELAAQVKDLAAKFDENPAGFFVNAPITSSGSRQAGSRPIITGPKMFTRPVTVVLEDIERNVGDMLGKFDEDAVRETFVSLLGYYMSKTQELRTQRNTVLEGCKSWSVDACGLPAPPFVSETFLQRLGFSEGRTKRFDRVQQDRGSRYSRAGTSWEERDRQNLKGRTKQPDWMSRGYGDGGSGGRYGRGSRSGSRDGYIGLESGRRDTQRDAGESGYGIRR